VENGGEVCLEEEVERLRRSGMSVAEISRRMGVDRGWVEDLVARSPGGTPASANTDQNPSSL
jgi:transposase